MRKKKFGFVQRLMFSKTFMASLIIGVGFLFVLNLTFLFRSGNDFDQNLIDQHNHDIQKEEKKTEKIEKYQKPKQEPFPLVLKKEFKMEDFYDFNYGFFSNKNEFGKNIEKCVQKKSMKLMVENDWKVCPCCGFCGNKKDYLDFAGRKSVVCPMCSEFSKLRSNLRGNVHECLERHRALCTSLAVDGLFPNSSTPFRIQYWGSFFQVVRSIEKMMESNKAIELYLLDYHDKKGEIKADVTDIQYEDSYFSGGIIVHVLEHVVNIKKAIEELGRVTKSGGWLIIAVPCVPDRYFGRYGNENLLTKEKQRFFADFDKLGTRYNMKEEEIRKISSDERTQKIIKALISNEHRWLYYCPYFKKSVEKYGNFKCKETFEDFEEKVKIHPFLQMSNFEMNDKGLYICYKK